MSSNTIKKLICAGAIFAIVAIVILSPLHEARAAGPVETASAGLIDVLIGSIAKIVALIVMFLTFLISKVGALLMTVGGFLLDWGIGLNRDVLVSPTVQAGFKVTLSIANLGFVLAIIIIAFATILRIPSYQMKQLLWKLIVAALLINFSLTIAGIFLDFTGVLTNFFIKNATVGGSAFSDSLATAFGVTKFEDFSKTNTSFSDLSNLGAGLVNVLANAAFVTLFTILSSIAMLGTAFMILIRYIVLVLLLILMPLAWLFWIFPNLSHLTSKWWNKFFHWTFFMPAATFFLYLAVILVTNQANESSSPLSSAANYASGGAGAALTRNLILSNPLQAIGQMIAVLGLLVGGLIAAQSMGIAGAGIGIAAAKGVGRWTTGAIGKIAKGAVVAPTVRPAKATALGIANLLNRPALRWIPGAKGTVAALSAFASRKGEVEDYQKKYLADLDDKQLEQVMQTTPVGPIAKAAILAEAAKRKSVAKLTAGIDEQVKSGKIKVEEGGKLKEERLKLFATAAKEANPALIKEIVNVNPEFSTTLTGKPIEETVAGIRADKASEISKGALLNKNVALALNESQISSILRSGSKEQAENLRKTLEEAAGDAAKDLLEIDKHIIENQKTLKEAKEAGDKIIIESRRSLLRDLRAERQKTYNALADRKAYDKLELLKQRIAS